MAVVLKSARGWRSTLQRASEELRFRSIASVGRLAGRRITWKVFLASGTVLRQILVTYIGGLIPFKFRNGGIPPRGRLKGIRAKFFGRTDDRRGMGKRFRSRGSNTPWLHIARKR